ncbi:TRAP transporter substrate-binding protein [Roseovarius lutimaris]|nr:TRAP transporter substrate-binding protein DctP [Roseovarius lutimaris]
MKISKIISNTAISATCYLAASILPAQAQEASWKMHVALTESRVETQTAQKFVDAVNSTTDDLSITLFSGGSLGIKDADMLRILPRGNVIQAAALYPGYLTRDNPDFAYILPPGVASDPNSLRDAASVLKEVYGQVYDAAGIKALGFIGHATRDTHIMCKEPVNSLEELRKRKVRVWEKFHVDTFEALGVSAQIIGQSELYVAMQTGVVDCAVYPVSLAVTVSLQEVAPYASYLFPYVLHPWTFVVSQSAFDKLSPETQATLVEVGAAVEAAAMEDYVNGTNDTAAMETFVSSGGTILEPFSDEDRAAFRDAARNLWSELSEDGGDQRKANYEKVNDALK